MSRILVGAKNDYNVFPARSLPKFRYSIKSIPILAAVLLLGVLAHRSYSIYKTLTNFTIDRKPRDLAMVVNGVRFIDKPPVFAKKEILDSIEKIVKGAHRNTLFLLGESRFGADYKIQSDKAFSAKEIYFIEQQWKDGKNYNYIYGADGLIVRTSQGIYHLIAVETTIKAGKKTIKYDLLAATSVSRAIEKAFYTAFIELAIMLSSVGVILLAPLYAISKAQQDKTKAIALRVKCEPKWWWPKETIQGGETYNRFLDAERLYKIQIEQSTSGQIIILSRGLEEAFIHSSNKAMETISGYTQAELEGQPLNLIVPRQYHHYHFGIGVFDEELGRRVGMHAYSSGCPFHGNQQSRLIGRDRTVELINKDGRIRKIVLGVFYVGKNDAGEDEWAGVVTDVTELTDAVAKAETFAKDVQNITHIFAHDLKAGEIASAKAGEYVTETAKELITYLRDAGHLDKEIERSLNFIAKYSARITASCQNNFALIDQRNKLHDLEDRITPEPHLIREIFDGIDVSFNRSDGKLVFVDECPDETKAYLDIALFLSAMKNLVKNGFAYNTSIDKTIEIKAAIENDQILFSVKDNGIGFPPDYIKTWGQIQGQAARLDPSREGSGTGLFSVRRIIEAHRGASVELVSEQCVGSNFLIKVGTGH